MRALICGMMATMALSGAALAAEPACQTLTPAIVGGPVPAASSDTVVMRGLGTANYEIDYKGKVFLMDTYFDRPGRTRSLGFKVDQVKRADVIFIGHAHSDHISDVAAVARQTGGLVVGSKISIDTAIKLGVPESQTKVVADGDQLTFGPVKVLVALARHSTIQDGLIAAHRQMYQVDELGPLTPEQEAHDRQIGAKGSSDPHLIDQGTMAFALVLPSKFSIVLFDTAGPMTDGDRALARKLGRVDVLTVPYQPHPVAEHQVRDSWPFIETFNPKLVLPTHHDAIWGVWLDLGLQPLREKLRDERPDVKFVDPLVRSAICIQTAGKTKGALAVKY
jgi:L-ascorbate metabolism protein UlaG (beta-lactamase superfamily)